MIRQFPEGFIGYGLRALVKALPLGIPAAVFAAKRVSRKADAAARSAGRFLHRAWIPGRVRAAGAYLALRRAGVSRGHDVLVSWQPIFWVLAKIAALVFGAIFLLRFVEPLGQVFDKVVGFFQLDQIYNFELPTIDTYNRVARLLILAVIGLYGGYLLVLQLQALFSTVIFDRTGRCFYYLESYLVYRRVHTIPSGSVESITLRQTILSRLFTIGGLLVTTASGERLLIRNVWNAAAFVAAVAKRA